MSKKPKIKFEVGQTVYFLNSNCRSDRYQIIPASYRLALRKGKVEKLLDDGRPWLDVRCERYSNVPPCMSFVYLTKKDAQPELKKRAAKEKAILKQELASLNKQLAANKLIA